MTTSEIRSRLRRIEKTASEQKVSGTAMLLKCIRDCGYQETATFLCKDDSLPFFRVMNTFADKCDSDAFECYRGLVPDEEIRKAYNFLRNWCGDNSKILLRSGVIDEAGNVMPGYRMAENGRIVNA